MSTQKILKEFEIIYKNTYNKILKYVICKCSNLDDVNDIIQETYIEFYKKLKEGFFIYAFLTFECPIYLL